LAAKSGVVVEFLPEETSGRWLKTAEGWRWEGPTVVEFKDPKKRLSGYWRTEVEATLIFWGGEKGGIAEKELEVPIVGSDHSEVNSPESGESHDPDDVSSA